MAKPNSVFFENLSPFTSSLHRIEASPRSLPPHRIRSYAIWILVIVENEVVGSRSGLQWHNFLAKPNENLPIALSVSNSCMINSRQNGRSQL
jgi:hypothetical protein